MTKSLEAMIADIRLKHGENDRFAPILTMKEFNLLIASIEQKDKRISELESRQLSVKPPEDFPDDEELLIEIELLDDVSMDIKTAQWLKELRRRRSGVGIVTGGE